MEIIRSHYNIRPEHHGCVATIGNFDGVHLGHQAVLGQLSKEAKKLGLPEVVITFEPYPQEFFAKSDQCYRLTKFREKSDALNKFLVDRLLLLRFNQKFANIEAKQFIKEILVKKLGVKFLVVGDDFCFGKGRLGNYELLKEMGRQLGFKVARMATFQIENERVSSTRIRNALFAGDFNLANKLLGRHYKISGKVCSGAKLGRTIGFPTANILLHRRRCVLNGVFIVNVDGLGNKSVPGVANIGVRPTVKGGQESRLEVHLFDFSSDIYGRHLDVNFLEKIRDEIKFDSFEDLKLQISRDSDHAKAYFNL